MSARYDARARTPLDSLPLDGAEGTANQESGGSAFGGVNPAAFWLGAVGLGIQTLALAMIASMYWFYSGATPGWFGMMGHYGAMMTYYPFTGWYGSSLSWLVIAAVVTAVGAYGLALMNSGRPGRLRSGSILLIVAAVLAFPTMWGFWLGSILMFVGGILGLTTTPRGGRSPQ